MDGVLFVAFFFPLLVGFNIAASSFGFSFAFWCAFGKEIARVLTDESAYMMTQTEKILGASLSRILFTPNSVFLWALSSPPVDVGRFPFLLPLLVNCVTIFAVGTTYGIGGAMQHAKNGWSFVQPMRGGARFVLIQLATWTAVTVAIVLPWVAVEDFGLLRIGGFVLEQDAVGHGALSVAGAGIGLIANTLAVLGVMSYDPHASVDFNVESDLRNLDKGRWRWDVFGEGQAWWWLFMMSQFSLVVFSLLLGLALDNVVLKDKLIEGIVLSTLTLLLAVPVAVTNAVAGKWKHGTRAYRLYMPGRGGKRFAVLQAFGWIAFALSTLATLLRLGSLVTASETLPFSLQLTTRLTASLGFASFCFVFLSLFFFDKSDVVAVRQKGTAKEIFASASPSASSTTTLRRRKRDKRRSKSPKPKTVASKKSPELERIIGKRQKANGKVEFLVSWVNVAESGWVAEGFLRAERPGAVERYEHEYALAAQRTLDATNSSSAITADLVRATTGVNWEECEDEFGNIFYYNTQTGQSVVPDS